MKINALWATLALCCFPFVFTFAQEVNDGFGYNPQSVRPIFEDDQLFRKTLWYRIDLQEKQNKPLHARGNELTKVIIDAAKAGIIRPFNNDSLVSRMSMEQFMQNLAMPNQPAEQDWIEDDLVWDNPTDANTNENPKAETEAQVEEYMCKDFTILEMKEDLVFDKKRGRMYHDIQAITIFLPADRNPAGIEKPIATFSYRELVENVFRDNPSAIWYNNQNPKQHRNLEEAFELGLFAAHLVKYANSEDNSIEDVFAAGKAAIVSSMQMEHELLEYEHNLWEY